MRTVVKEAAGRIQVYAGIGLTCPRESLDMGKQYLDSGVDAVVARPPYHYPVGGKELRRYYEWLADKLPGPLILYNIPITTKVAIPVEVIVHLSRHPNIAGLKDSERNVERQQRFAEAFWGRQEFSFSTGVRTLIADAVSWGADGAVPSTANLEPGLHRDIYESAREGDRERALALQVRADALSRVYQEGRTLSKALAGLKALLAERELCGPAMFAPLLSLDDKERGEALRQYANWRNT